VATGDEVQITDPFVEALTHDAIVDQINRLKNRRQTELERLLEVFDQGLASRSDPHLLDILEGVCVFVPVPNFRQGRISRKRGMRSATPKVLRESEARILFINTLERILKEAPPNPSLAKDSTLTKIWDRYEYADTLLQGVYPAPDRQVDQGRKRLRLLYTFW
jgi:hypothetical protein